MNSKSLSKIVRMPIYVLQLFTGAKSFRDNPIIGSTLLNRLGLHVLSFDSLNQEVRSMHEVEVRQCIQGDTLTQRVLLNDKVLASAPECTQLLNSAKFHKRMKYTAARNSSPIYYVQNVRSNARDADADPQRHLHSDTFHATMKAWFFLDDVGDHNGPFTYVPGSHKLTR